MEPLYSFYISAKDLDETKRVIRSFPSLRFVENPRENNGGYIMTISGAFRDIGRINSYFEKLQDDKLLETLN